MRIRTIVIGLIYVIILAVLALVLIPRLLKMVVLQTRGGGSCKPLAIRGVSHRVSASGFELSKSVHRSAGFVV